MLDAHKDTVGRLSGKFRLTLACGDYAIVRALKDAAVAPDGIELALLTR